MRRYIILFLITGIVWSQTEFDKLVLKDGTIYLGEYSNTEKEMVYFKPQNAFAFQTPDFDKLFLKDGTTYLGEYSKTEKHIVYFKPQNAFAFQPVPVQLIKRLQLKDGHYIIGIGSESEKEGRWKGCFYVIIIIGFLTYLTFEFDMGFSLNYNNANN